MAFRVFAPDTDPGLRKNMNTGDSPMLRCNRRARPTRAMCRDFFLRTRTFAEVHVYDFYFLDRIVSETALSIQ